MGDSARRLSYYRPKRGANWPLWVILGIFVLGLIGFVASSGRRSQPDEGRVVETGTRDTVDCMSLHTGGCYALDKWTPMCAECGMKITDANTSKRTMLPPGTQIGIRSSEERDGVRWYEVQAVKADGITELGSGWVSTETLKDQRLKMLR